MIAPITEHGRAASSRDVSLDMLRGIAVVTMVLVNLQGSTDAAYRQWVHAPWHGLTIADTVFPLFLLAVGLATPLALDSRSAPPSQWAVVRRALVMFGIGVALGWLLRPTLDLDEVRWTGVLQRIAIVYLVCAWVSRAGQGPWLSLAIVVVLLVGHALVLLVVVAPGETAPALLPGTGISGWLDRHLLPGRALRRTHDPEGVLSTVSAIATGLAGVGASRWLTSRRHSTKRVTVGLFGASLCCVVVGWLAASVIPFNKALWTPSFALVNIGIGLGLWASLRAGGLSLAHTVAGRGLAIAGRTALTLFVIHMLLVAVLVRTVDGERIWTLLYRWVTRDAHGDPASSFVFAVLAGSLCAAMTAALRWRGWLTHRAA